MKNRLEIGRMIDHILIPYADCIAWEDFGATGSSYYDPNDFSSAADEEEAAFTLAMVQLEMRKYSNRHRELAKKVARQLGNEYVTYPWLHAATSRLIAGTTYADLLLMVRAVKTGKEAKKITETQSITEDLLVE